jgi:uncharacterized protein
LCIYRGTPMEQDYNRGELSVLPEDDYIALMAEALELLPPDMVIMRLLAEGRKEEIIAPQWCFEKRRLNEKVEQYLEQHDIRQGKKFKAVGAAKAQ